MPSCETDVSCEGCLLHGWPCACEICKCKVRHNKVGSPCDHCGGIGHRNSLLRLVIWLIKIPLKLFLVLVAVRIWCLGVGIGLAVSLLCIFVGPFIILLAPFLLLPLLAWTALVVLFCRWLLF